MRSSERGSTVGTRRVQQRLRIPPRTPIRSSEIKLKENWTFNPDVTTWLLDHFIRPHQHYWGANMLGFGFGFMAIPFEKSLAAFKSGCCRDLFEDFGFNFRVWLTIRSGHQFFRHQEDQRQDQCIDRCCCNHAVEESVRWAAVVYA